MKKVSRIIGMMGLAAVMAVSASCKKNNETTSSFTFEMPAVEGFVADDSKAYIDISASNTPIKWMDGDRLRVYSVDATNTTPVTGEFTAEEGATGKTKVNFLGEQLEKGSYGYFAFYPYEKSLEPEANNVGVFEVSNDQVYDPALEELFANTSMAGKAFMDPKCIVSAATCDVLNGHAIASMRHIFGMANVRIKDLSATGTTKTVKKVAIMDNNLHLTGVMRITLPEITEARLQALKTLGKNYANGTVNEEAYWTTLKPMLSDMGYNAEGEGNVIELDCSANGGVELSSTNKYFIIPVRPGALLKEFTVLVTYDNNQVRAFSFNDKKYISRPGTFSNIQITF